MTALTSTGLQIKRIPEILEDIVSTQREVIHPDISTRPDELLGQLNSIVAAAQAGQWELAEAVNDSANPLKAEGKSLDDVGLITGTLRQAGSVSTTHSQLFTGDNGTTILGGTILQNPSTLDKFRTVGNSYLNDGSCYAASYSVNSLEDNQEYSLSVNTTEYTVTSSPSATALEILNGLVAAMSANANATYTSFVDQDEETLTIQTSNGERIEVETTPLLAVASIAILGQVEALEEGSKIAPQNTVTSVLSSIAGITSTTNLSAYSVGRERESDEDYRIRILTGQQAKGKGTLDAILDTVANLEGVSSVSVIENDTSAPDSKGRPPKSFEVVVSGGDDEVVALTIWVTKPAGIESYGNTSVSIIGSKGIRRVVNYTRPVAVSLAIQVVYTKYDEEIFPDNGEALILESVKATTDSLKIDEDVIPRRYFGNLYSTVAGLDTLTVSVQVLANPSDTPNSDNWQTSKLAIDSDEFATTTITDISIIEG